jgi:hypothetical protein
MKADVGADKKRQCIDGRAVEQPTDETYASEDGKCAMVVGSISGHRFPDKDDVRLPPPPRRVLSFNRSPMLSESKSRLEKIFACYIKKMIERGADEPGLGGAALAGGRR